MEGSSSSSVLHQCCSSKAYLGSFRFHRWSSISSPSSASLGRKWRSLSLSAKKPVTSMGATLHALAVEEAPATSDQDTLPKIDKSGRFCSPRAARELALLIVYASCLEGSDPIRLFEKRINARREAGYEFDKGSLLRYNHMAFGGPPVTVHTAEEADELLLLDKKESETEAEVLSAPPKLVYSKLILRFARKLLVAVVDKWDYHVGIIDRVAPPNWKNEPAGRILELCILHLAMSEIAVLGTRHQIVINEAVDLAKRFCDGAAPRVINGCLRSFMKGVEGTASTETPDNKHEVSVEA